MGIQGMLIITPGLLKCTLLTCPESTWNQRETGFTVRFFTAYLSEDTKIIIEYLNIYLNIKHIFKRIIPF